MDLVTTGGKVVATSKPGGPLAVRRPVAAGEDWYFVRARRAGASPDEAVAYSSPVWVKFSGGS